MTRTEIIRLNEAARSMRQRLSGTNSFGISEIQKLPILHDWVDCNIGDKSFVMYLSGGDDGVAGRFFWNGSYEAYSIRLWAFYASSRRGIKIDIGAHTGAYTLSAIALGAKEVLSIEPHFVNFSRLLMNLNANRLSTDRTFPFAVSDKDGWADFFLPTRLDYLSAGGSLISREGANRFPVRTVTLDSWIGQSMQCNVSVIKIDVEGSEGKVLSGAERIIEKSRPVIFFECIDDDVACSIQSILQKYDYRFFLIDDEICRVSIVDLLVVERNKQGALNMNLRNRIALPPNQGIDALVSLPY